MSNLIKYCLYIVVYFNSKGEPITNLKLQKLLYYCQGWTMAFFKGKDIFEAAPEAWVHGPVYYEAYQSFKNGYQPIDLDPNLFKDLKGFKYDHLENPDELLKVVQSNIKDTEHFDLIDEVIEKYGSINAFKLELMTHREKPWVEARKGLSPTEISRKEINLDLMEQYFSSKIEK